jgi:outer membrane biosynthesis protein TonB
VTADGWVWTGLALLLVLLGVRSWVVETGHATLGRTPVKVTVLSVVCGLVVAVVAGLVTVNGGARLVYLVAHPKEAQALEDAANAAGDPTTDPPAPDAPVAPADPPSTPPTTATTPTTPTTTSAPPPPAARATTQRRPRVTRPPVRTATPPPTPTPTATASTRATTTRETPTRTPAARAGRQADGDATASTGADANRAAD